MHSAQTLPSRSILVIVGHLQIRLSTISLLSVAESYYVKKGFSLISHLHLNGYDLDVFEKTVRMYSCFLL